MRNSTVVTLAGALAFAGPLGAQTQYNQQVMQAMAPRGKYQPPLCPLKGGNFRTSSAGVYLKTAAEGGFSDALNGQSRVDPKKYTDILGKAVATSMDAIAADQNNAAGWYYLGRADLQLGDIVGADSAFNRLEKLSPDCAEEIKAMRQQAWVPLANLGAAHLKNSQAADSSVAYKTAQLDSGLVVLRQAQIVARYYPLGYYNMAATYFNLKQYDSAKVYFKIAQSKATDNSEQSQSILKSSTRNLAYLEQQTGDNEAAVVDLKKYLQIDPNDETAKRDLFAALTATGKTAEAAELQKQLMASGSLTPDEIMASGIAHMNAKDYAAAAGDFTKVLAAVPSSHDALFNLANAYLGLGDGKNLVATSQKLLDIDPLGISNIKLLFNGYRLNSDTAKQIEVYTRLQAIPTGVAITAFGSNKTSAKLSGVATGQNARNASDKAIPPTGVVLVFEFTNASGAVVATQDVAVPPLKTDEAHPFNIEVTGADISAWRYHPKAP